MGRWIFLHQFCGCFFHFMMTGLWKSPCHGALYRFSTTFLSNSLQFVFQPIKQVKTSDKTDIQCLRSCKLTDIVVHQLDNIQKVKLHLGTCFLTTVQHSKIENPDISKSDNLGPKMLLSSSVLQISTHGFTTLFLAGFLWRLMLFPG